MEIPDLQTWERGNPPAGYLRELIYRSGSQSNGWCALPRA